MIVDAHAHVFREVEGVVAAGPVRGAGYGRVRIGETDLQLMPPLCEETRHTPEMLLAHMDWAGVDRALLLQGPFYGECNAYTLEAAMSHPDRLAAAAYLDPWDEALQVRWKQVKRQRGFRAVKMECSVATGLCGLHPGRTLAEPALVWLWDALEQSGLVLVLDLGAPGSASYQTDAVREIARRHPGLRIVVAHLGQPRREALAEADLRAQWDAQVELALLPNVWLDTAALPTYNGDECYPFPSACDVLRSVIRRVGAAKVMWGTDIPGLLSVATYPQLVRMTETHLEPFAREDRAAVMGNTAARLFWEG